MVRILDSMKSRFFKKSLKSPFRSDERGVAAVEFAIIAPMIIGAYLALAEFALVLTIDRRISHSTSVAGDLATQVSELSQRDAEDLLSAVLHVANFNTPTKLRIRLTSLERDTDGKVTEVGKIEYVSDGVAAFDAIDGTSISEALMPRSTGIIVADVRYNYRPFGFKSLNKEKRRFLPDSLLLEETFLIKPRQSTAVSIGTKKGTSFSCSGTVSSIRCS